MAVAARAHHRVSGMGTVYDWRGTGLLPPSGSTIDLRGIVHHIPVVPNKPGVDDFITLANVLKVQGLSLQFATDSEGNVAIYNNANALCWQARGGNFQTCGIEHMHMTINESWREHQYRAAAWITWWVHRHHDIPYTAARVRSAGRGLVAVSSKGDTTHRIISARAGFRDRVDPGPGFNRAHVRDLARFYEQHRSFKHAPTV